MIVDNLLKEGLQFAELIGTLDAYSLDDIQIMVQQHAFDVSTMNKLRPYLRRRVLREKK